MTLTPAETREAPMSDPQAAATLDRLEAKIRDALEQAWYDGQRGHPSPAISRSGGQTIGEIKNLFHAAVKREARELAATWLEATQ